MTPITIDAYVDAVRRELRLPADAPELEELRAQLHELALGSTEADACAQLGDPAAYAATLGAHGHGGPGAPDSEDPPTFLGMPNTLGEPLGDGWRRLFDPTNPHILVPKVRGIGWTINLGAVAVKLRLIRPDDIDDDVLSAVRLPDVLSAALVPVGLAVLSAVIAAWGATHLSVVPTHWGFGRPDRFAPAGQALGSTAAVAGGVAVVLVGVAAASTRRNARRAVAALGMATVVAGGGASIVGLMLTGDRPLGWLALPGLVVAFGLGTVVGYLPIRAALRRVWRRERKDVR